MTIGGARRRVARQQTKAGVHHAVGARRERFGEKRVALGIARQLLGALDEVFCSPGLRPLLLHGVF